MTGRKKSVTRKKSGGRKKEPDVLSMSCPLKVPTKKEIHHTQMREELGKLKQGDSLAVSLFLKKWSVAEDAYELGSEEWNKDQNVKHLAKADVDAYVDWFKNKSPHKKKIDQLQHEISYPQMQHRDMVYQCKKNELNRLKGASLKMWLEKRKPPFGFRRMVWMAEELQDRNMHAEHGYLGFCILDKIPEDIFWESELKRGGL